MIKTYLVPATTQKVLEKAEVRCLNLGLLMTRYMPREVIDKEDVRNDRGKVTGNRSSQWLHEVVGRFSDNRDLTRLIEDSYRRWQVRTAEAPHRFTMQAVTRLIVGLGGKGALEIGITLQHVTGLPVIPGSALKGLTRAYALYSIAAQLEPQPKLDALEEALSAGKHADLPEDVQRDAQHFQLAFGNQEASGVCVFYDAVVSSIADHGRLFEADVMTPHFPDYYAGGEKFPGDDQSPKPVTFLTVGAGTHFAFAVGSRAGARGDNTETVTQAATWLVRGLQELGIGSKTAAGYGAFGKAEAI